VIVAILVVAAFDIGTNEFVDRENCASAACKQAPLIAKHPLVISTLPANVEVEIPCMVSVPAPRILLDDKIYPVEIPANVDVAWFAVSAPVFETERYVVVAPEFVILR